MRRLTTFQILALASLLAVSQIATAAGRALTEDGGNDVLFCSVYAEKKPCRGSGNCQWDNGECLPKECKHFKDLESCKEALDGGCMWLAAEENCRPYQGLTPIQDTSSPWNVDTASMQIQADLETFIATYFEDNAGGGVYKEILDDFLVTRQKDNGIRKLAKLGKAVGQLLHNIPAEALGDHQEPLIRIGREIAEMLKSAHVTEHSHVEGTVMRGWPMFRRKYCKHAVHEAYNFGHIGQAVAMAAKAAAKIGQDEAAVGLLKPVLEQLYDSFIDEDIRKHKLDDQGRLVLVPKNAPADRLQRYLQVEDYSICLDEQEMYNHGTSPARAAIEVLYTINLIDWDGGNVTWPLPECPIESCKERISNYVIKTGQWMKSAFDVQQPHPVTGDDKEKDKYPGPDNTTWYTWRYQDVSGCLDERAPYIDESGVRDGEFIDRPQDFQHGKEEMAFIHEFMEWASGNGSAAEVFNDEDISRLMVTFLNRGVYNYAANSQDNLFACDVEGYISGYSCNGARGISTRSQAAVNWLILPYSAKAHMAEAANRATKCDAYRMVKTVLPLAMGPWGDAYDSENFGKISEDRAADAILAKYHFYNYDYGISQNCGGNTAAVPTILV